MSTAVELKLIPESPNAEFVSLFQNSPLGLVQCGTQGSVIAMNAAMKRILGRQNGTASLHLADLIHSPDRRETEHAIADLVAGRREFFQISGTSTNQTSEIDAGPAASKQDRQLQWTAWRVWATEGATGQILAVVVPLEDVAAMDIRTKKQSAGGQGINRSESLETIGRLAGGIAHDFNNLLTGVLLYCDLMMATLEPGHRVRRYAEEIRNAGVQASGLVRQLLAMSRPGHGESRALSLNDTVEGMHQLLTRLMGENIELRLRLSSALGLIQMDPTQAQQILLNLVLNARDAMPAGGQITVETSDGHLQVLDSCDQGEREMPSLRCAMLVVADNGHGMDAGTRAHLFEPFFTTKSNTKSATANGTGLGLSTVHDIVTTHGGLIDIDSEPGRGTRVTVLLPAISPAISPARPAPTSTIFPITSIHPAQSGKLISSQKEERQS